jgi:exopolysaccharide biosynthesis operon protein EpsL
VVAIDEVCIGNVRQARLAASTLELPCGVFVAKALTIATIIVAVLFCTGAAAEDGDVLMGRMAANVMHDSNVFRLSKPADTQAAIGASERDDLIQRYTVGGRLDAPYRQQRVFGHLDFSKVLYQRFDALDHDALDQRLAWQWAAGRALYGELGESYSRSLAGFANFEGRIKNIINVLQLNARANYFVTPRWQVEGGVGQTRIRNETVERRANDTDELTLDTGFKYVLPIGDFVGLAVRTSKADFPNRVVGTGALFSADYAQHVIDLAFDRGLGARVRIGGRLGYVQREYAAVSQRDYAGPIGNLTVDWSPGVKSRLTLAGRREIGAFQDLTTSYYIGDGVMAKALWRPWVRVSTSATYDWQRRRFTGNPGFLSVETVERRDVVRLLSFNVAYQAVRNGSIGLSMSRESRTSNTPGVDYVVNSLGANVALAF